MDNPMKTFAIYRSRLWPQNFIGHVNAVDIWAAFAEAKALGILNPIVGEV